MYEIILGRREKDLEKYGTKGTVFIAKHYVTMDKVKSLANPVFLDVARPHAVLIAGKRGEGKSYTMGVIAEGMVNLPPEVANNISALILDTMGIYWTFKFPNRRDFRLLEEWGLEGRDFKDQCIVFVPYGFFDKLKAQNVPVDKPFSIATSEINPSDWCALIGVESTDAIGILIERIVNRLKKERESFSIEELMEAAQEDEKADIQTKQALMNKLELVRSWGLFQKDGTKVEELLDRGKITVLDISYYTQTTGGFNLRALAIGIVLKKILEHRIIARKIEELRDIEGGFTVLGKKYKEEAKKEVPLVWVFLDEAHEFIPAKGKTLATDALVQVIREGRQPGVSLILASQQPGKLSGDVISQCDIVISHRVTSKEDVNALNNIMQSYLPYAIERYISELPRIKGAAIALDDTQERIYPLQMRPRMSWHGGEEPIAISEE
jgi:hypothetical protein